MKRKEFIRDVSLASMIPLLGSALWACNQDRSRKRILVLVRLIGGNDGLNTLIPTDNYKNIVAARPSLFIPEHKILTLKGVSNSGLHPSLEGIRDMYDSGLISFIQGVGYENPSYSHFRSSDIWLTGSSASEVLLTGWIGRYLEEVFKNYPESFPSSDFPHPPSIKVGDSGTIAFQATLSDMSIIVDPSVEFNALPEIIFTDSYSGYKGKQIDNARKILNQTAKYADSIRHALSVDFAHSAMYPSQGVNSLADQLKAVTKMIYSGLQTTIYMVDLKDFDTHDTQVDTHNTAKGRHADLLKQLSQAISCFWDDVVHMNKEAEITGMVFSEFGRRIMSNASYGTDHGAAQPLMFFGGNLNGKIIGNNPVIPDKVSAADNLEMQYDFRSVYSTLLKQWISVSNSSLQKIIPGSFQELFLFKV